MGKRSNFARRERDFYPTPAAAVGPLLPHLPQGTRFVEPCAGNGALVDHLVAAGHTCAGAFDICPQRSNIDYGDARELRVSGADMAVTNPPWTRADLHAIIVSLSDQLRSWLLFDADWVHTRQAIPLLSRLRQIVSVGRVKWIDGSQFTGKDNVAWHLFDRPGNSPIEFVGRV